MTHTFDSQYWEDHWHGTEGSASTGSSEPHPCMDAELGHLPPGTALEAGCGEGAEAGWLAARGWKVTGVDVSPTVIARATQRHPDVAFIQADLTTWEPPAPYDLVTTFYAHPSIPQLDFYVLLQGWVAPGGTLVIVGHRETHHHGHEEDGPPARSRVSVADITALFDPAQWRIDTAYESDRDTAHAMRLNDVTVRATRLERHETSGDDT